MLERPDVTEPWLALVIGNTRLHWGFFNRGTLKSVWHTSHITGDVARHIAAHKFRPDAWQIVPELTSEIEGLPEQAISLSSLWIASVVPKQSELWMSLELQPQDRVRMVERSHIPIANLYPTLGIDRAINLLGASSRVGWPVLVIDAGTALTFTAGAQAGFYGGAILPGLRLQGRALVRNAADLGGAITVGQSISQQPLPERWATDTNGAIASGLIYGTLAIVTDYLTAWQHQFSTGKAILTGGDGPYLHALLQQKTPTVAAEVQADSLLMFRGMQSYRKALTRAL